MKIAIHFVSMCFSQLYCVTDLIFGYFSTTLIDCFSDKCSDFDIIGLASIRYTI